MDPAHPLVIHGMGFFFIKFAAQEILVVTQITTRLLSLKGLNPSVTISANRGFKAHITDIEPIVIKRAQI